MNILQKLTKTKHHLKSIKPIKSFIKSNNIKLFSGGHHHISGKVDLNKIFTPQPNHLKGKFLSLSGLVTSSNKEDEVVECEERYNNSTHPLNIIMKKEHLANVHPEENPYTHEEPYGYLFSDDPFEKYGEDYHVYLILYGFLFVVFVLERIYGRHYISEEFDINRKVKLMYHASYTASLIEEEIRKIREEDYKYRVKYHEIISRSRAVGGDKESQKENEGESESDE